MSLFHFYCKQVRNGNRYFHKIPLEWIQGKFITSGRAFGMGVKCAHSDVAQLFEWAMLALGEVVVSAQGR